ncbi:hypothetical protein [Microviridae sp.]|nr:hypothetical protein [Microviridae sp.]
MKTTNDTNVNINKLDISQLFILRRMTVDKYTYLMLKNDASGYSEKLKDLIVTLDSEIQRAR